MRSSVYCSALFSLMHGVMLALLHFWGIKGLLVLVRRKSIALISFVFFGILAAACVCHMRELMNPCPIDNMNNCIIAS